MGQIETKAKIIFDVENRAKQALENAGKQIKDLETKAKSFEGSLKTMRNVGVVAFAGIATGIGFAVNEAAKLETLQVAFETMIGSADEAKKVIGDLRNFTATTPFQFEGVTKAARQLLSFGVSAEDLQGKLRFLGDISAGANVPLSDMASIFGKAKAKGKAMTEELLQLSDRGVPIISVLSKQLGVAEGSIFEMASQGKISFDILQKAMMSMSSEGGIFFNLMDKQSATVAGRLSTLKDNIQIVAQTIGEVFLPIVADLIEKIMPIIEAIGKWTEENPKLVKTILLVGLGLTGLIALIGTVGLAVAGLSLGITTLGITLASVLSVAGFGVIIAGLVFFATKLKDIVGAIYGVEITWKEVWDGIIDYTSDVMLKLFGWIDKLVAKFDTVKFIFQDIAQKVTAGAVDLAGRVINVDDAIITPKGDVIQPADDDFIIATKNPGGMGGQTFNFDFSNAMITNKDQFMNDIKTQLGRSLQLKQMGI